MRFILENKEFDQINNLDWKEIRFVRLGDDDTLIHLGVILPGDSVPNSDILLSIQTIQDTLYQPHITVGERLRRRGVAFKVYRALIEKLGHLYSGKGRRLNPMIDQLWAKLRLQPDLEGAHSEIGDLVWIKGDPNGEQFREFIENK